MILVDPEELSSSDPQTTFAATRVRTRADGTGVGTHPDALRTIDTTDIVLDLVQRWVPAFCDGIYLDLAADGVDRVIVAYPLARPDRDVHGVDGNGHEPDGGQTVVPVHSDPLVGEGAISGTLTCTWHAASRPTDSDLALARLLAEHAVAAIRIEMLTNAAHDARARAANLEEALTTNREIGQAIGVLMATDRLTAEQAFGRLRSASQHSHRKLREIAADVVTTGALATTPEIRQDTGALDAAADRRSRPHVNHSTARLRSDATPRST